MREEPLENMNEGLGRDRWAVTYFVVVFVARLNNGFVLKLADLVGGVIPWACRWLADTRTCLYARSRIGKMELGLYGPRC